MPQQTTSEDLEQLTTEEIIQKMIDKFHRRMAKDEKARAEVEPIVKKFNVDLERVYSLKLSDERILWSNPDRLTKDAYDAANEDRRTL